ncbi:low affinity iron permease family protein [Rudanella paleaurantiibacter]|uniref:Low affinity iron permease family protein n=1 Tax=Rudanella paleaurantiibacter TaxID=2614655 RepID=A0A7J5U4K0_9BACT|nr:low affinity iron permease family protein [Rudanella paleaurantiibacter]KAB7732507.1 low affinity iron permease family protein [Rudanella paleaurantiibacter]
MENHKPSRLNTQFDHFATYITKVTGSSKAFLTAFGVVLVWAVTGPIFNYSEDWQLVINTGTTIVTFLMVFIIQKAQNKDSLAIQLKLNELIAATKGASNRLVAVEEMGDDELEVLCQHYHTMAELTRKHIDLRKSHSVEEAIKDAESKLQEEGIQADE